MECPVCERRVELEETVLRVASPTESERVCESCHLALEELEAPLG